MQDFLAQVVVTFGDLVASLGYIVIGILSRRLWLVVILALIWSAVAYAVHLQDQLGVPFQELLQAVQQEEVQAQVVEDMPLRAGIALAISFAAWACMGLIIGSFRPPRRRTRAEPERTETRETLVPRAAPSLDAPQRAAKRGARKEPTLDPGSDEDGVPPLPIGLRARQPAPAAAPAQAEEAAERGSSFDVVLPRDPSAAAAALKRLYGEEELRRLLSELRPTRDAD